MPEYIIFIISISCWISAQTLKVIFTLVRHKTLQLSLLFSSGGMPSAHSSFVTGVATAIGLVDGFSSSIFALAFVVASVVMYDASGVRYCVGTHAKILNNLKGKEIEKLKEKVGHTRLEVISGCITGAVTASLLFLAF